jgi:hypothetical protein
MTGARTLLRLSFKSGRWLLPWMGVLLVSASLTYGMTGIVAGVLSDGGRWSPAHTIAPADEEGALAEVEQSPVLLSAATPDLGRVRGLEHCAEGRRMYLGVDAWIVAESRTIDCKPGPP